MRHAILILALAAFGAALPQLPKQRAADQDLLKKQQDCVLLLQHITQEIPDEQLQTLGASYDIESNYQQYDNPILVKYYVRAVQVGLVQPRGTVYSNSISRLRKEVALLHRVFLSATNYQTFISTAAWARVHVNKEQFIKAFIGAVLQRPDTEDIILPPLYEIIPHYYFDARIIQEIHDIIGHGIGHDNVIVPVNYTAYLPNGEHQVSYFTQDIGLANYYGYINLAGYLLHKHGEHETPVQYQHQGMPQDHTDHIGKGARYYYLHQQLLAHYELNRLGNGLGPIEEIDYEEIEAPYQPHLRYMNGLEFPERSESVDLTSNNEDLVKLVKTLERRLIEAIDRGHVFTPHNAFLSLYHPQGLNILGELIEGTGRSVNPRYYGSLQAAARELLGNAPEVQNIYDYTPSVLELGQIAVRDPAFYQLYKKIIHLFKHYQYSLPAYQYNDVLLPGVNIQNVEMSQLVTFFNDYYVDLDCAAVQPEEHHTDRHHESEHHIKGYLKRLDHKPYEYKINVQSERNIPGAVVRVYLGPKHDYEGKPISISEHRHKFVELDQFIADLQTGENVLVRNSRQAPGHSHDYPSVQEIKKRVNDAVRSQEPFYITEPHQIFGFPARLSIPKGRPEGYPLQLLVVISQPGQHHVTYGPVVPEEYQTYQHHEYEVVGTGEYSQEIQHEATKTVGFKKAIEVFPVYNEEGHEEVKNHYADLYTRQYGQYPHVHNYYQVGQGKGQHMQGQYHGQQGQFGQYGHAQGPHTTSHEQQHYSPQYTQGTPYQYGQTPETYTGQHQQYHGYEDKVVGRVQGGVQSTKDVRDAHNVIPTGAHTPGVYDDVRTYQGQSQQEHGHDVRHYGSGQYHAGGYQGIWSQGQRVQDGYVSEYYHDKHISEIIGGAISLDERPLGYPLDRPLSHGVWYAPNIYVQTVHVYHEGQPTAEMYYH